VNVLYVWLHDAQYDLDVISFDRDLVNSMFTRAERKAELKSSLDAQVADERRRKQQGSVLLFCPPDQRGGVCSCEGFCFVAELEEALAPPDLTSGSILPTLDLRKFSKHADADLRTVSAVRAQLVASSMRVDAVVVFDGDHSASRGRV
jgi:hypothetical protein